MKTIDAIVNQALHTAEATDRCQAADAQFAADFVSLSPERQASCWRGLSVAEKSRLVVRRIEALGKDWTPAVVEAFIAKYDARFAAGPIDAAIEGALERLAEESATAMRLARADNDKAGGAFWQRAATSYTNALIEYRKGVRPEILASGAQLLPSRRAGEAPHIVRMDGDWTCSCKAGAAMHWSLALIIGIETAYDDMARYDDGNCDPPNEPSPLGDDEGDSLPSALTPADLDAWAEHAAEQRLWSRIAGVRRAFLVAA
jgi:hypothetical protein